MPTIKEFKWNGASLRQDGTPYLPENRRGYEVSIWLASDVEVDPADHIRFVSTVPNPQNNYVMPYGDLGDPLGEGNWLISIRDVDIRDTVDNPKKSEWSTAVAFSVEVALPKPPTGIVVYYYG